MRAVIAAFYGLTGVLNALWGATLPATDARLDLGPGRLGVLLMAMAVGALVAMPIAGWLAQRWTAKTLLRWAFPTAAATLAGPAASGSFGAIVSAAVLLGMMSGALNVSLSVQAVAVERALRRPIMASLHGTWTLGAVAGGGAVAWGLSAGIDARALMATGALALAVAGVALGRRLPAEPHTQAESPASTAPLRPRLVVLLGIIGAAAFLTEGAATDWAGVHATRVLGTDAATASLVYTVFFVAMTAIRFVGDYLRARLGAATTIRLAGAVASAGYVLVLVSGSLPPIIALRAGFAIAGWALAGAGMAVVWPVVTSALGAAAKGAARRLSTVTTISYGGGLVGPALIGFAAAQTSLPTALFIPAALAVLVALVAPAVLRAITSA